MERRMPRDHTTYVVSGHDNVTLALTSAANYIYTQQRTPTKEETNKVVTFVQSGMGPIPCPDIFDVRKDVVTHEEPDTHQRAGKNTHHFRIFPIHFLLDIITHNLFKRFYCDTFRTISSERQEKTSEENTKHKH